MIERSRVAVAVLFTCAAAGCASPGAQGGAGIADVPEARKLVRLTEKQYTDEVGRRLVVRDDGSGKERVQALDEKGQPLEIVEVPLSEQQFCSAKAKQQCQPVTFVSDGAFMKMGGASCYCYWIGGTAYCYGSTCR